MIPENQSSNAGSAKAEAPESHALAMLPCRRGKSRMVSSYLPEGTRPAVRAGVAIGVAALL